MNGFKHWTEQKVKVIRLQLRAKRRVPSLLQVGLAYASSKVERLRLTGDESLLQHCSSKVQISTQKGYHHLCKAQRGQK